MKKFYVLLRVFVSVEIIGALIFAFGILADVNGKPYGTKLPCATQECNYSGHQSDCFDA